MKKNHWLPLFPKMHLKIDIDRFWKIWIWNQKTLGTTSLDQLVSA